MQELKKNNLNGFSFEAHLGHRCEIKALLYGDDSNKSNIYMVSNSLKFPST